MTIQSEFKNFAVLTVNIRSVEHKTSKAGKPYAVAAATLPMEKGQDMPLRIVAVNGISAASDTSASIFTGQHTLVGRLGYDERDGKGTIVLFPTRVEPTPSDGKLRNYVTLTLRAGQDSERRYSNAGNFWGRVRMALGQGKDPSGNYRASLWLTVKGFTSKEGDDAVPQALVQLNKGNLATITGRLIYEVSPTNGKGYYSLVAYKVEAQKAVVGDFPY